MPHILETYGKSVHKKLHRLGIAAGVCSENDSHKDGALKFIEAIKKLNKKTGIPDKIKGIKKEDIPVMARHAEKEANPLYPVPVIWGSEEFRQLIRSIEK